MRIVSLLPAATEMVCLLGLEKSLVGISDDSDYPKSVVKLPKVTAVTFDSNSLSSLEIDKKVKEAKHRGSSVFHIDRGLLSKLSPDLILTQELCPVCAPAFSDVEKAAKDVLKDTKIISLEPHSISDIFKNIKEVAKTTKVSYEKNINSLKSRLSIVSKKVKGLNKPFVLVIEWLDPIMIAGHWVPEMVEKAGGKMLVAKKKERSRYIDWEEVVKLDPDIIIIAPCGFDIKRTMDEISLITNKKDYKELKAYKNKQIFLVDGNAYLTRPGPRIIDGVEILSEIIHPQFFLRKHSTKDWQPT